MHADYTHQSSYQIMSQLKSMSLSNLHTQSKISEAQIYFMTPDKAMKQNVFFVGRICFIKIKIID